MEAKHLQSIVESNFRLLIQSANNLGVSKEDFVGIYKIDGDRLILVYWGV